MSLATIPQILFQGVGEHEWSCLGTPIVYALFPSGVVEDIKIKTSGLDDDAKKYVTESLYVAHALVSVNRYGFENQLTKKIDFVKALAPPVRDLFVQEYIKARIEQHKHIYDKHEELKKHLPNQT